MTIELQFRKEDASQTPASFDAPLRAPSFFNNDEWSFLLAVVERLIPQCDGLDGLGGGVPAKLDRRIASPHGCGAPGYMLAPFLADAAIELQLQTPPQELYRTGIAALDQAFRKEAGYSFAQAEGELRDVFLFRLAAGRVALAGPLGQAFLRQLLTDIKQLRSVEWGAI